MARRLDLHTTLVGILGSSHVYFQAPPDNEMQYPCIVYRRDNESKQFAGNKPYRLMDRYMVTVIDRDPDNVTRSKVAEMPMSTFNRFYVANNLNHDVFNVYF